MKNPKEHTPKKPMPKMWEDEEVSVKKKSLENEKRLSEMLGFRLTPGSGNTPWVTLKGDGRTDRYMVECKETDKDKLSIGTGVLRKLCDEAAAVGKDPILVLSAYGMPEPIPKDWVLIPAHIFEE